MKANQLAHLLIPAIILSISADTNNWGEIDDGADSFVIGESKESSTSPGGFSAVAEPAGPADPEAAKRAAEEYAQKCIVPQVEVLMTMGMTPGPPQECTAQANTGAPYPNYTVSHPYEVTGNGYVIRLRTSWSARWRIAGQTQWHQVNGTVTTTETSSPFNLYIADSYGTTP